MADEKQRAGILLQQRFEQFQRLNVQIVGRFVEHEHVGGLRKEPREQQAVALAAGQASHLGARALGRKQEVPEIRNHVLAAAADLDEVRARADDFRERRVVIELGAELVEIRDRQLGTQADGACIRADFPEQEFEQRRLAAAIGPEQSDFVAALDHARKIIDDAARAEALADVPHFSNQFARALAGGHLEIHLAEAITARGTLAAQLLQPQHAALVARAARFDALANPHFFLREQLVEPGVLLRFGVEQLFLTPLVLRVVARKTRQPPAIKLDYPRRHIVEKTPVVRHEQHAAAKIDKQLLQPFNAGNIEMVGRLVEQQQRGFCHQRPPQRNALLESARQCAHARLGIEAETRQRGFDA